MILSSPLALFIGHVMVPERTYDEEKPAAQAPIGERISREAAPLIASFPNRR
jgi:hypothetical protein